MKRFIYAIIVIINFYILPFIANNLIANDFGKTVLIFLLLVVSPLISLIGGVCFTQKKMSDWYFPLIVVGLFIPSIYVYYNDTALVYSLLYFIMAIIGIVIGKIFKSDRFFQD